TRSIRVMYNRRNIRKSIAREDIEASMVSIRPATEADRPTILKIVRDEQLDPTKLNWQNFLLAEVDRHIVGIGQIRQHADSRELGSLAVLPEYRNQGIAGQLIGALEARAG